MTDRTLLLQDLWCFGIIAMLKQNQAYQIYTAEHQRKPSDIVCKRSNLCPTATTHNFKYISL